MPLENGLSPVQWMFGRAHRSVLPTLPKFTQRLSESNFEQAEKKQEVIQDRVEQYYNRGARDLPEFEIGTKVRIRDPKSKTWKQIGVIIGRGNTSRSYRIKAEDSSAIFYRNRKHLKRYFIVQNENDKF